MNTFTTLNTSQRNDQGRLESFAARALESEPIHLLTVKETATILSRTPWWVRQLISSGEIRAINVGGHGRTARWRVDPEDLKAFLASRESRPRDLVAAT